MNKLYIKVMTTVPNRRVLVASMLCGLLINSSGCGIPGLRSAKPGALTPATYALNNGMAVLSTRSTIPTTTPTSDSAPVEEVDSLEYEEGSDSADDVEKESRRRGVESFVKPASYITAFKQDDDEKAKKAKDLEDDMKRMKDEATESSPSDNQDNTSGSASNGTSSTDDPDASVVSTPVPFQSDMLATSGQLPKDALYSDPFLMTLISDTLAGNQELKILAEEINIACNEAYARSGEYRPFVDFGAGAGYEKTSRHTRDGAVENQLTVADGRFFPDPLGDFEVGANVLWQVDIWKRLRNAQRAAGMRYLATQEGRNFIVTRVVADVAENYYELLALDNRLLTLKATIEIQQKSLVIARSRKKAGRATELAVKRFEAEVEKNISELSIIRQEIVEKENRINYLAGRFPQPVQRLSGEFIDLNLGTLGTGVPSELLQNRADIREAEREVIAAGLDLEVARTRFYPQLNLSANLGWNAFRTGYLFRTPESLIYGLAADVVGPLINKRAIQADYRSANAAQLQAIYDYQRTVLEAHIEVVNQITKVENFRESIVAKKRQLDALQASVEAANRLFQNARAEYVEVLLAQRELQEARLVLIDIKKEQLTAVVNAYQALGGGGF